MDGKRQTQTQVAGSEWRSCRIVADRGPVELPFTPMELDLPLASGEKVRYVAAAIIDDYLEIDIYPMEKLSLFLWPKDKEVVFFVFRNEGECLIRHFDRTHFDCSHVLVGDSGFYIGTESLPSLRLCLYRERRKVYDVPITDYDAFCDALFLLWERYRDLLQNQAL